MNHQPYTIWIAMAVLSILDCASASADTDLDQKWSAIRVHQPPELKLSLTLPKAHYFQGEEIDATVSFSNGDKNATYTIEMNPTASAVFKAKNDRGVSVPNPLQWLESWENSGAIDRLSQVADLGNYTQTIAVNESLRFDKPGVYRLFAESADIFKKGDYQTRILLVSDPVTITIDPLTPEVEKQTIADALQKTANGGGSTFKGIALAREGVAELGYLQTPAARAELLPFLANVELRRQAQEGFFAAPDPLSEAANILAAVKAHKLVLDENGADFYAQLKTSGMLPTVWQAAPPAEAMQRFQEQMAAINRARQEITAAMLQASQDQGPAHIEALWTAFTGEVDFPKDKDGGKARAALAPHQLELSEDHACYFMACWLSWGSEDFLPLVRREVSSTSSASYPAALMALVQLRPDEARPRVIDAFRYPDTGPFSNGRRPPPWVFMALRPMPLPEFDDYFKTRLLEAGANPTSILPVICAFGSPGILPDLIDCYKKNGAKWDEIAKTAFFFYWLRCDPKAGTAAFEQEIESHGKDAPSFFVQYLGGPFWSDDALPVVQWAFANPKVGVLNTIDLLMKHGDVSSLEPIIAALEKIGDRKVCAIYAGQILSSDRWTLTNDQKKRLTVLKASQRNTSK